MLQKPPPPFLAFCRKKKYSSETLGSQGKNYTKTITLKVNSFTNLELLERWSIIASPPSSFGLVFVVHSDLFLMQMIQYKVMNETDSRKMKKKKMSAQAGILFCQQFTCTCFSSSLHIISFRQGILGPWTTEILKELISYLNT